MIEVRRPTRSSRVLHALTRTGGPGLAIAHRLERLRSGGVRSALSGSRGPQDRAAVLRRNDAATYRRIWHEAASALGAEVVDELGEGFLVIRRGEAETLVQRNLTMLDHPASVGLALDKSVMHRLLAESGVPVPRQVEARRHDLGPAASRLRADGGRWVVKPASDTGGGYGVTCGVETEEDLWRAWLWAAVWNDRIVLEQQVPGNEFRLLFVDGTLVDAVRRSLPAVVGDGKSTVSELIEAENGRRAEAGPDEVGRAIKIDLDCELAVRRSGLGLRSIVPDGTRVVVKGNVGDNCARENATERGLCDPLVRVAARAAQVARLRVAGVDLVTPDAARPLDEAGGAVLEVNASPGLQHHYLVRDPEHATPVAVCLLERLLGHSPDEG